MYFIHHWCQYWVNKVLLNLPRRSHQQVSRSATRATLIMRRFARMGFVSVPRPGDSINWPFNTLGSLAHYMLCSIPQWLSVETARSPAYCSVHHPGKPEDGAGQPHFNDTRCVLKQWRYILCSLSSAGFSSWSNLQKASELPHPLFPRQ